MRAHISAGSPGLTLLSDLTPQEIRLFDTLHAQYGYYVPCDQLAEALGAQDVATSKPKEYRSLLYSTVSRLRGKLADTHWAIDNVEDAGYRLLEAESESEPELKRRYTTCRVCLTRYGGKAPSICTMCAKRLTQREHGKVAP